MKHIGIFGLGCIGSILTKHLIQNKTNKYHFFNRSHKSVIKISFNNQLLTIPIQLEQQTNEALDWLLICLKKYHIEKAHSAIKELIGPHTKLVVFRNGINLAEDFTSYVNPNHILETIIDCPTQKNERGEFVQFKNPNITLPNSPLAIEFKRIFNHPHLEFKLTNEFKSEQWKKLIESSSLGSIQSLTMKPCSVLKDNHVLSRYLKLLKEGIEVAKSAGIKIDQNFILNQLDKLKKYPDSKGSSMLSDALSGRQLELDAKIGAIVHLGKKNNVHIPESQRIDNLLRARS